MITCCYDIPLQFAAFLGPCSAVYHLSDHCLQLRSTAVLKCIQYEFGASFLFFCIPNIPPSSYWSTRTKALLGFIPHLFLSFSTLDTHLLPRSHHATWETRSRPWRSRIQVSSGGKQRHVIPCLATVPPFVCPSEPGFCVSVSSCCLRTKAHNSYSFKLRIARSASLKAI